MPYATKAIDGAEVAKHNTKKSCWIVLDSNVYDVTRFLGSHPGGAAILLRQGGSVSIPSSPSLYTSPVSIGGTKRARHQRWWVGPACKAV